MIKHETDFLQTSSENINSQSLFYNLFYPEKQTIKASLLILHGMQEHSVRYNDFAKYLANQGFAVLTYDHLGHGNSVKSKKELGFFQIHNPDKKVVQDATLMAELIEKLYPKIPHFVLGHSMGSFIVRCLLQKTGDRFEGAIIVGTGGKLTGIKLIRSYFSVMNKFFPHQRTSFNALFNKVNNRRYLKENSNVGLNWLSVNVANRKAFIEDELCGIDFTNNGYYTLFSLYAKATKKYWAKTISKTLPFLFLSGEEDTIGNFGKGVKQTVNDLKSDGFNDISLKLYPNLRHEILNEEIKERIYADILKWIEMYI